MKLSSIFVKALMAVTGAVMVIFLGFHLVGNGLLFLGAIEYNAYTALVTRKAILIPAEIILSTCFVVHLLAAIKISLENYRARPRTYCVKHTAGQSTFASRNMWWTGSLLLVFLVYHILHFKYGTQDAPYKMWGLVTQEFKKPWVVAVYLLAMVGLGFHLDHALGSLFQSLGLRNASGHPRLWGLSTIVGWGLALGFATLPLWGLTTLD
ncbi:MAG: succinate dehydrogenase cytochrome b subunit [Planctomycetota bacterium]